LVDLSTEGHSGHTTNYLLQEEQAATQLVEILSSNSGSSGPSLISPTPLNDSLQSTDTEDIIFVNNNAGSYIVLEEGLSSAQPHNSSKVVIDVDSHVVPKRKSCSQMSGVIDIESDPTTDILPSSSSTYHRKAKKNKRQPKENRRVDGIFIHYI
jgi:hypothetical protein